MNNNNHDRMELQLITSVKQVAEPKFLIVDDDDLSQDLACFVLAKLGFTRVQPARNGKDGLRAVDAMPQLPDFVICDIFMPEMDGIELVGELARRRYPGGVILVSGGDNRMLSVARRLAAGSGLNVLGAFAKPLPQDQIGSAILAFTPGFRNRP